MINKNLHLAENIFERDKLEMAPTRDGFGNGTVEAGREDENVVVLCADLADSTRASWFKKEFPKRYIEMGVAEQNLATTAAGMANYGKVPYIASYAAFSPGRNLEQIRTTIALNDVPVIVGGMHAGVSVGPDGATHQPLEDIGYMRAMPNMKVFVPADAEESRKITAATAKMGTPAYIRYGRSKVPTFTTVDTPFEEGKALELWRSEKPEVLIASTGSLSYNALEAAKELDATGIGTIVQHHASVKPFDTDALVSAAKEVSAVVSVEEHQVAGGLGGLVSEELARHAPTKMAFVGVHDKFGQSGTPDELIAHYGLDKDGIMYAVRAVLGK